MSTVRNDKLGIRGSIIRVTPEIVDGRQKYIVEVDAECMCAGLYVWPKEPFPLPRMTWIVLKYGNSLKKAVISEVHGKHPMGIKIEVA